MGLRFATPAGNGFSLAVGSLGAVAIGVPPGTLDSAFQSLSVALVGADAFVAPFGSLMSPVAAKGMK